jgi:hypothetical protein
MNPIQVAESSASVVKRKMEDGGGFVEAKRSSRSAWKSPDFSFLSVMRLSALTSLARSSYQCQCSSCTVKETWRTIVWSCVEAIRSVELRSGVERHCGRKPIGVRQSTNGGQRVRIVSQDAL